MKKKDNGKGDGLSEKYKLIKQNNFTNRLSKTGAKGVKAIPKDENGKPKEPRKIKCTQIDDRKIIDERFGTFAMIYQDLKVTIEQYHTVLEDTTGRGLRASTWATLDILVLSALEHKWGLDRYEIDLDYYMKMRGLADRKQSRRELESDLSTLARITVSQYVINEKTGKKREVGAGSILDYQKIKNTSKYSFGFAGVFWSGLLTDGYIMPVPLALYTMNYKNSPHAFFIGRKFYELYNINVDRKNTKGETTGHNPYVVKVGTLMDACPDLPRIEEVHSKGRQICQRIVEPFMNNLEALKTEGVIYDYDICPENVEVEKRRKPGGVEMMIAKNAYPKETRGELVYNTWTLEEFRSKNVFIQPAEGYPDPTKWRNKSLNETKKRENKERRDEAIKLRAEGKEAAKIKAKEEKKKNR